MLLNPYPIVVLRELTPLWKFTLGTTFASIELNELRVFSITRLQKLVLADP